MKLFTVAVLLLMNSVVTSQEDASILKLENNRVIIRSFYKEPQSVHDENTIILKGVSEGEFVEMQIQGHIKDFQHVKLEMRDSGDLYETDILHTFKNISNKTLLINSYLPTGIPSEKIKWKSLSGTSYEFTFAESGKDGEDGELILNLD